MTQTTKTVEVIGTASGSVAQQMAAADQGCTLIVKLAVKRQRDEESAIQAGAVDYCYTTWQQAKRASDKRGTMTMPKPAKDGRTTYDPGKVYAVTVGGLVLGYVVASGQDSAIAYAMRHLLGAEQSATVPTAVTQGMAEALQKAEDARKDAEAKAAAERSRADAERAELMARIAALEALAAKAKEGQGGKGQGKGQGNAA